MSGQVAFRTEVVPASGVVNLPNANFIFIISSTGNAALKLTRTGIQRGANTEDYGSAQLAGLQIGRTQRWDFATFTAAAGVTITFLYGYTDVREDQTLFNQQIAVISGVTAIAEQPSATLADTADTAQAINTQTVIAANLLRRRITIGVLSTAGNGVRVSQAGGAGRGVEIQPGTFVEFRTTAALTVRNTDVAASGAGSTWYALEET